MRRYSLAQFFRSRIFFLIGIIFCVFIALNFVKVFSQSYSTRQDINRLKSEINKLEKDQQRLQEFYALLSSDFFAEKEARLKFGLQKQGERAVVIQENPVLKEKNEPKDDSQEGQKPSKNQIASYTDSARAPFKKQQNPQAWWDYFFGMQE